MIFRMIRQWAWNRRRQIFHFNDGRKVRSADPIAVAIALHEHSEFLPRHLGEAADGDSTAQQIVARAACDVFGVTPLAADGRSGMTVAELIELMFAFDAYLFALKKNIEPRVIKPVSTASASQSLSEPITSDTSGSGSTENASPSGKPTSAEPVSSPLSAN